MKFRTHIFKSIVKDKGHLFFKKRKEQAFRTDSYNTLHSSLSISGIHRNTQIIVVTNEMYLVREIRDFVHMFLRV